MRKAIDFALNRKVIIDAIGINSARILPDYHLYPIIRDPQYPSCRDGYSQDKSRVFWKQASDALKEKGIEDPVLCIGSFLDTPRVKKIMGEIETQLGEIGIKLERCYYYDESKLDMSIHVIPFTEPYTIYRNLHSSQSPWGYKNKKVDQFLDDAMNNKYNYNKIQNILSEERFFLPLFRYEICIAYTKQLKMELKPSMSRFPCGSDIALWRFE